jgi:outer membrane protein OmpA-like peptidoglycan-associated protein
MTRTATALAALLALNACASGGGWFGSEASQGESASATDAGEGLRSEGGRIGSAARGLVASYLDQQAADLDAIPGAEVERRNDSVVVSFQSSLIFATGEYTFQPGAYDRLRSLARTLNQYPKSRVIIRGHTDSTGDDRFNQTLSEERSDRVRKFLIVEKVAHDRITAIGFGEQMPVATNNTAEGRHQNRRVEIEIRPTDPAMNEASG